MSIIVSAIVGILITAGAIFGSFYKVTSPTILAPWFALALLVVGFASTFVLRARRPASTPARRPERGSAGEPGPERGLAGARGDQAMSRPAQR